MGVFLHLFWAIATLLLSLAILFEKVILKQIN